MKFNRKTKKYLTSICKATCHYFCSRNFYIVMLLSLGHVQPSISANENAIGSSIDCTEIDIDYIEDPNISREERISRMNAAFFRSLDKFDNCQSTTTSQSINSNAGGATQAAGDGGDGSESGSAKSENSQASSGISGTEIEAASPPLATSPTEEANQSSSIDPDEESGQTALNNGAVPEDIPSADNDSVFESQVRTAAINETDPDKKRRIWNEYRKLKGLPAEGAVEE